jgi:hypothetical protein
MEHIWNVLWILLMSEIGWLIASTGHHLRYKKGHGKHHWHYTVGNCWLHN